MGLTAPRPDRGRRRRRRGAPRGGAATRGTPAARSLGALGSLVFMLVVNFFLFRVLPGDPARTLGRGRLSTPEQLEEFNKTYGLTSRSAQQFVTFLKNTLHGDLGLLAPLPQHGLRRSWSTGCGRPCCWSGTLDRARRR